MFGTFTNKNHKNAMETNRKTKKHNFLARKKHGNVFSECKHPVVAFFGRICWLASCFAHFRPMGRSMSVLQLGLLT